MGPSCNLCQYQGPLQPHFPAKGISRCPRCQLIFYEGDVDGAALYTEAYFNAGEYRNYLADKRTQQRNFSFRVKALRKLKPSGTLLEIGAAYGLFLDLAREYWDVKGVDVVPEGAAYARKTLGVELICGEFLDLPEERGGYDIICMWDTIEHLARPMDVMRKASRWLKPGGLLALTTCDIGSLLARWRKEKWRQIHPPTHLFYFTEETLRKMFTHAGLETVHVSHPGAFRSLKFILYELFVLRARRLRWLYSLLTLGDRIDMPVYMNTYDLIMVVGRKAG